ncbi:binding-protein-dependent transport systems inner membrane component [Arcobacter nitrofigilis DSM 7299]|uniref:Binding-protein-dependent transport systems inner membrane component n=1 Tax=Arcobacter nitrofigilis (strain ATCC 33309 / DSM 7299 / CCUG 15893 / LMG 7604 / NCTC 12251 / CI) TaxID=572480 RepID=D5V576_ARCNC|nr:sugar ABC transporter permease [Arcobacter nitrofigilis]ADG93011.1 binding-protein-dependent transport systems inner membrane component [Arcobacter nitrofigilis DSM 7299]
MRHVYGWLLLLPGFILIVAFTHYPTVTTFINSFFSNQTVLKPKRFIGLDNYEYMLHDPIFMQTLKNTLYFSLTTVPLSIMIALAMAIFVQEKIKARSIVRLAYFTPTILPMVAVANIWLFFYAPEIGLINQVLHYFGFNEYNFLGDRDLVLGSTIVMTVWKEAGFFMIFYLAALQGIPKELYEAAKIEGSSPWTTFTKVTFPLLMPTTFFVMINALINSFKMIDHLFILTKGGPDNASNLLLYYIYDVAFSFFDYSYAATLTMVLLTILIIISLIQFGLIEKKIHYK